MGYTIRIGELESTVDNDGLWSRIYNSAKKEFRKDAPAFGEPTDNLNDRWPSYTAWHNAMEFLGLTDLFYNKEHGLLREHPGCFPINREHQKVIHKAYADFYKKYPRDIHPR